MIINGIEYKNNYLVIGDLGIATCKSNYLSGKFIDDVSESTNSSNVGGGKSFSIDVPNSDLYGINK